MISTDRSDTQRIVTLGGGTGSLMLLSGLRDHAAHIDVSTIMAMADDGGSTGKMREEFDMPAFGGDFRDALVGLAANDSLAKLFMYRFERGNELRGHSVGNLMLLGLFEMTGGDMSEALRIAHEVLRVRGNVYPSTTESVHLQCTYDDGTVIDSQNMIDNSREMEGRRIVDCKLVPSPQAFDQAIEAIMNADKIILGPGDLYSNVIANILVDGIGDAINRSSATVIYVCNLLTKGNQTGHMSSNMFVDEVHKYLGGTIDYAIVNNHHNLDGVDLTKYKDESWGIVINDTDGSEPYTVITDDVWWEGQEFRRVKSDMIPRSFIRHNPAKLAQIIVDI